MDPHLLLVNLLHQYMWLMMCQNKEVRNSLAECPDIVHGCDRAIVELFHIIFLCLPYNFPQYF